MDCSTQKDMGIIETASYLGTPTYSRKLSTLYRFEWRSPDGDLLLEDEVHNLVTTAGHNYSLTTLFKGSNYTAGWYIFLTNTTPTFSTADTSASHAGWTEFSTYSGGSRPAIVLGTAASGSIDNSASKTVFTFSGSGTVGGAGLASSATQGSTSDIIYGEAVLSANKPVQSGETLTITITLTSS